MSNIKQSLQAIYIANKRMITLGACVGIIIVNLIIAKHYAEVEHQLRQYNNFKTDFDNTKQVNIRLKAMYDNLQLRYDELAAGSYCINSIEEGGE